MSDSPEVDRTGDPEGCAPSLPALCSVNIRGWENDNQEEARRFGIEVLELAREISRHLDLSRLEAIIIGMNYEEALASVDRGDSYPLAEPTNNEYGRGLAMAMHLVRGDEVWSAVVIWTPLARRLLDTEHEAHKMALHTFVHELVHVDDIRRFTKTYPGGWKAARPRDGRDATFQRIVDPCRGEYTAQRRSAWADPEAGLESLNMLSNAMRDIDRQIRSARLKYRLDGDMDAYWSVVAERVAFLFQAIGYATGHADWIAANATEHPELAERYQQRLMDFSQMPSGWLLNACREAVQPFFQLTEWSGQEIYDPLIAVAERFLNQHGMFTRAHGDGIYVDVPYTGLHDL